MTNHEIIAFGDAVTDAYTFHEFSALLLGLNRNALHFVSPNALFRAQVQEIVHVANRTGWISQLVVAVVNDRPHNPLIKDFFAKYPNWDQN